MATIDDIPYAVSDTFAAAWWSPMVKDGGLTYVAFTSSTELYGSHYVSVAKCDENDTWTLARLQSDKGNGLEDAVFPDDWGHNQTATAVDGSGRLHVITSLHQDKWTASGTFGHYYRMDTPSDITSMVDRSTQLPNQSDELNGYLYTYPIMTTDTNGDVFLIVRRRDATGNAPMVMYKWTNSTSTWSVVARVADVSGQNVYVYPDHMTLGSDGKIHIAFAWHAAQASPRRHLGSYLSYDPATNVFKTVDGTTVTTPVSWSTTNLVYQPLTSNETTTADEPHIGHQSASVTVDPGGNVHIAYRYRATEGSTNHVRRARWTTGGWSREEVWIPSNAESDAALGIKHTGSEVTIYYVRKQNTTKLWKAVKGTSGDWVHSKVTEINLQRISLRNGVIYAVSPQAERQLILEDI